MKVALPLILLILPIPVQAQTEWWKMESEKKQPPASNRAPQADTPSTDIKQKIKTFRNNKRFSVAYDKFKDETWTTVGPFVVGGDLRYVFRGSQLYMTARFRHSGQLNQHSVEFFSLWFQATGKQWEFLKSRELHALVDGERFSFGEGRYDGDVRRYGGLSEWLGFSVPTDIFAKLGRARKVELKIGNIELTLKDEHKEAFRDLYTLSQ